MSLPYMFIISRILSYLFVTYICFYVAILPILFCFRMLLGAIK